MQRKRGKMSQVVEKIWMKVKGVWDDGKQECYNKKEVRKDGEKDQQKKVMKD
jgi:hypothetical protein